MIGTLVKYVGPDEGYVYKDFIGAHGLIIHYSPMGSDGQAHARIRWIKPVTYGGRTTRYSDFGFKHLEVVSDAVPCDNEPDSR